MKYILLILVIGLLLAYPFAFYFYHPYVTLSCTMLEENDFKLEKRALFWKNPSYSIFKMSEKSFEKYATILEKNGFMPFIKISSSRMHTIPNELEKQLDNYNPISLNKNIIVTEKVLSKKTILLFTIKIRNYFMFLSSVININHCFKQMIKKNYINKVYCFG